MDGNYICNECNKSYKYKKSLKKHRRVNHDPTVQGYECLKCKRKFKLKHHLKSHEKNCEKGSAQCTLCDFIGSINMIYEHYKNEHGIHLSFDTVVVQNESEFNAWKKKLEDEDFCSFVTWRSKFIKKDGTIKCFFRCHRAGKPKQKRIQQLRKSRGTTKIGGYCPAHLDITICGDKYQIKVCRTHVGHELGLKGLDQAENKRSNTKKTSKISENSTVRDGKELVSMNSDVKRNNLLDRMDGIIHFENGIDRHEEILSDDFINFINDGKSVSHKKTLLKEQFIALIDEADEGVELGLISKTLKYLSDSIGSLKKNLPPPLVPIRQHFHY